MVFLHLFIINKSGGLIYHRELSKYAPIIDVNILLRIGSSFHSLCSIAVEASPVKKNLPAMMGAGAGGNVTGSGGAGAGASNSGVSGSAKSSAGEADDDGIEVIEGDGLILCCFQTRTGVKFVITAKPGTRGLKKTLREIYVLYADCTLKDPFYELEMPIRCELFTQAIDDLMERIDPGGVSGRNGGGNDGIVKLR
mmetsp:Transcript_23/g.35  ORF Transcript_23/g.35 Transcript_23/m.35 type:complete len:196 (+) Transcript_23:79-666(+)